MKNLFTLYCIVRHVDRFIKVQCTLGTAFFALYLTIPSISYSQPQCYPSNNVLTDLPNEISFDQFMGINLRRADPIEFAACVGNAREYHDWDVDEVTGKRYPENEYEFHPANEGESVITSFDHFYNRLRGMGLDICATLKNSSVGVSYLPPIILLDFNGNPVLDSDGNPVFYNPLQDIAEPPSYRVENYAYCPVSNTPPFWNIENDNAIDPLSYEWRGDYVTQYVNRYGGNPASPLSSDQDKNTGDPANAGSRGLVRYIENWNEQDHWWADVSLGGTGIGQFTPEEYATMSAVDFTGYSGSASPLTGQNGCSGSTYPIGLSSLGSEIQFVMGGPFQFGRMLSQGIKGLV